jgi:hypothetical protein
VSEYRKELLKSAIVAIMSASLLGAATYHLVQPEHRSISVAFALGEERQFSGIHTKAKFNWFLALNFTFLNGSSVEVRPFPNAECSPTPNPYTGEFDATDLQKIAVSFSAFHYVDDYIDATEFMLAFLRNRTIAATLIDQEMTDLGSGKNFGTWGYILTRPYNQTEYNELISSFNASKMGVKPSTGYWKATRCASLDANWEMSINELGDMLHGSGTANITFKLQLTEQLKYKLTTSEGDSMIGNATLSWSGMWGIFQLTYEEGKISWVKYNFTTITMRVITNE